MIKPDTFKQIMDTFNSMKNSLDHLEKDYSQVLEKGEALLMEQNEEATSIG